MKSSKHQAPSSREIPSTNIQTVTYWTEPAVVALELNDDSSRHAFDLEERTAQFGEAIVRFCKKIPRDPTNDRLTAQLAGCGTSIGANYCEANEAVSKKDFRCTVSRSVKEAKETKFFLRMIAAAEPRLAERSAQALSRSQRTASNFRQYVPQMRTNFYEQTCNSSDWSLNFGASLELGSWSLELCYE
jgi:four helix bundle protein